MNIASSLVESYMYSDMFNREYDGGSYISERITAGGAPVNTIAPLLCLQSTEYDREDDGPLANKVVPTGLVIIHIHKEPDTEYEEDSFHFDENREVLPDSLHDILFESILQRHSKRQEQHTPKKHSAKKVPKLSTKTSLKKHKKKK